MTEFELGEKVTFHKTLSRVKRVVPNDEKNRGDVVKRWEYVESPWLPAPVNRIGIIVGARVLSNGHVDYDGDGFSHYTGVHRFTAYLVAYDLRRAPVLVLPEDVKHLDNDPAGWVSLAQHRATVDAALSDAMLRQDELLERAQKAEALATENGKEICRLRNAVEKAEDERDQARKALDALIPENNNNFQGRCRAEAKVARVEALADFPLGDCEGHPCIWPEDIRAALAEPERDEEDGR